jgi:hypothetical protein
VNRDKSVLVGVDAPKPILTSMTGSNADIFPSILKMYVKEGSIIADVTWGRGAFWSQVDTSKYDLRPSDLLTGTDFRHLPYEDHSIDCLVLDPPYCHGGKTLHAGLQKNYNNVSTAALDHWGIIRLYGSGIIEASRVLKPRTGIIILKCQDEIESGKQCWSHMELTQLLTLFGFEVLDLLVLVQDHAPMQRQELQHHARKNHSFFIVGKFKR